MTHNSTDRVVDIYSEPQKQLMELTRSIIEMNSNLVKQYGYDSLRGRYRVGIKKAELTPSVNYRYIFASYAAQLHKYAYQTRQMGLRQLHGLRHAYAQRRYKELTTYYSPNQKGWECPFNGEPKTCELTKEQKSIDFKVRHILTRELGHSRLSILKSYCG